MPLILFSSPKGGVGKTTLAAHVAAILARRGYRVLALDLDPQNALRLHLGLSIREEGGYLNLIDRGSDWRKSVIETPAGVRALPFGVVDPRRVLELSAALLDKPDLLAGPVREMLAEPGLVVIIDGPPGPSAALSAVTMLADLVVVVLLADAASASLIPQIVSGRIYGRGTLVGRITERTVVAMNQVELDSHLSSAVLDSAVQAFGPRLLGAVCRDDALAEALANQRLLTDEAGGAAEDLLILADAIIARAGLAPAGEEALAFPALADWGLR
jgi:cellulose synthase operon protein YhjQ